MQLFLMGYILIEICEIITVGGFPLDGAVRRVSAISIAITSLTDTVHLTGLLCSPYCSSRNYLLGPYAQWHRRLSDLGGRNSNLSRTRPHLLATHLCRDWLHRT